MIRFLLLGLVLAGVWYLYRMVTQQGAGAAAPPPEAANDAAPDQAAEVQAEEAEELAECPICRAYVPVTAHEGCGRPDCPIPAVASAQEEGGEEPPAEGPPKQG